MVNSAHRQQDEALNQLTESAASFENKLFQ